MMMRCDHCRQKLGSKMHRYWQMRFCSQACADAYSDRLTDATRLKIRLLDHASADLPGNFGLPRLGDLIRQHLPR
jgi:hypothetical protein